MHQQHRDFGPFIPECTKRGIGKTKAYELANAGLIDTFTIGTKRYVLLDSLLALPERLAAAEQAQAALMAGETTEFRRLERELKAAALARSPEAIHHLAKARAAVPGGDA